MDFYRFFAIKDWTCDKIIEYYYKTYKQKGRKKLLDNIKKDLQKIANSDYILDETRKRKAQEILDYWKHWTASKKKMLPDTTLNIRTLQVEHQILTAGNSGTQNIDNRQRKHHREETTDDEEPEEVDDDEPSSKIDSLNVVEKSLELPKDKSKRIKKSNIGHESSTSSRQNDIEVDEIDMTLSENPIIERLIGVGGIDRYKIVFLPEENDCDVIKLIFNKDEWSKLETDWINAEKKTLPSSSGMNENVKTLLKKYNNGINDATFGYDVNLMKLPVLFDETSIVNRDTYNFIREWPTQWIKSVFNAFLLCFQLPINPLHDCDLSEYSYRDRIVNLLLLTRGEVENTDRKDQKNSARPQGQRRSIGWDHDAILIMKANNVDYRFCEVVGNACIHDDQKMIGDREKILKSMQLGLFRLRKLLSKQGVDENGICKAETFGILIYRKTFCFYSMHYVDDLYLVDQFEGFTIPDNSGQLAELLNIIEIMFTFKQRVMDLHHFVQSLYKQKSKFQRRSFINESAVKASPTKRDSLDSRAKIWN
ncbi:10143_t:CDS:10 [Funneliformis caledonium]|uniref:10143_t:CDS:1 n=1 Tax=Funneliformis caledonium TaxID=1117310 RepID=A0A9N9HTT8_9GLOM|nr:10143_t:CDS:10 [Funneliformis caledonium]